MPPMKILLADDVELFLELEKTFFRREGFTLLIARNGQEAVDLVRAERPTLVFMDLYMPQLDGDEACRQIKADPELRTTPVVMVTHGGREEDLERCRQAGCDEIVLKPINRHQFMETARRFLAIAARMAPRVDARLRVRFGTSPDDLLEHFTINISSGGLFLETTRPFAENAPLYLEFGLPGLDEPFRCRARVAWVNAAAEPCKPQLPAGVGVQFLDLPLEKMQQIREFIQTRELTPSW
ncbi:response regulator [Desulfuromonas carbonis]